MRVSLITSLIIVMVIMSTISACKKYVDGPLISLRTPAQRLAQTWSVISYKVNGVEKMNVAVINTVDTGRYKTKCDTLVRYASTTIFAADTFRFTKDGSYSISALTKYKNVDTTSTRLHCTDLYNVSYTDTSQNGVWEFLQGNKQVQLTHVIVIGGVISNEYDIYTIKELKESEMILSTVNTAGQSIEITMIQ